MKGADWQSATRAEVSCFTRGAGYLAQSITRLPSLAIRRAERTDSSTYKMNAVDAGATAQAVRIEHDANLVDGAGAKGGAGYACAAWMRAAIKAE